MYLKKIVITTALLAGLSGISINAGADASQSITLQGIITNTTCSVTVNGGKPVLNVGVFKPNQFTANTKLGSVSMPVTLSNCGTAAETGDLVIQGLTSLQNADRNIFVSNDSDSTGFMIAESDGTTIVKNGEGPVVNVIEDETTATYNFSVGMASATDSPAPGSYSAPILIAYVVK